MSTPNFTRLTLKNVYAYGEDAQDEVDFDIQRSFITDELQSKLPGFVPTGKWYSTGSRDGGYSLGYIERIVGAIKLTFNILSLSGYYVGANIDVHVTAETNDGDDIDIDDLPQSAQTRYDATLRNIERVLTKCTQRLLVRGIFSNGEAVYERF